MTNSTQSALIFAIGEMIVEDPEFQANPWHAIGLVATLNEGDAEMSGYRYLEDGSFQAASPLNFGAILDKLMELQAQMEQDGDGAFVQSLIHITKPDYDLRMQFEHTDPERWWPRTIGADMSEFAEQLRPSGLKAR